MCGTWAYCPNRLVVSHAFFTTVWLEPRSSNYGAFSLPWPVAMQMFWGKRKFLHKKRFTSHGIGLGHQHGRCFNVSGHQNGGHKVTSDENALYWMTRSLSSLL